MTGSLSGCRLSVCSVSARSRTSSAWKGASAAPTAAASMRAAVSRNCSIRRRASRRSWRDRSSAEPGLAASPSTILKRMRSRAARRASRSRGPGVADRDRERRDERAEPPNEVSLRCRVRGEDRDDAVHLGHRGQGLEGGDLRPGLVQGADHDLVEQDRPLGVLGDSLRPDHRLGTLRLEVEEVPIEADARQGEDTDGGEEPARGHGGPGVPIQPADPVTVRAFVTALLARGAPLAVRPAPAGPGAASGTPRQSAESRRR